MGAAFDWVASLYARLSTRPSPRSHRSSARRASRGRSLRDWNRYLLQLERLEDRTVPSITVTGQNLTPSESVPEPLMAATFTDTTPSPVANYNATIDWGDGTLTAGTVTGTAGGPFTVTGTHTYAEDGSDTITVTVTETADDMDTASGTGTATVQEGNFALQGGGTLSATEGVSFSNFVVGTFNDFMPPSPDPASSFTASIDWGDGNTSAGTITGSGGNFTVTGDHTYVEEISGISYAVTVQEPSVNFSIGPNTVGHSVTVADAQISTPSVTPPSNIQEGIPTPADFNIATFNDPAGVGVETASGDFAAAIDWGDGTTDTGTVVSDGNGDYHVNAPAHTYTGENINGESEGDATIAVTVTHDVLAPLTGTATATVGDPNIVATGGVSFSLADSETLTLSGTVATFTDPGNSTNYEDASDYSATIDWGDGVTTPGFIVFGGGTFTVLGNHTYADETIGGVTGGVVNITTRITHESLPTQTAISTATISDPNIVATGGFNFTVTEGSTVSGTVATFTDPANSTNFEDAADYSATIDWGDGTTTDGFIVFGGGTLASRAAIPTPTKSLAAWPPSRQGSRTRACLHKWRPALPPSTTLIR